MAALRPLKTFCEKHGDGWRFVRRLNPKKGAFPWLEAPKLYKQTIWANNEQDAITKCRELARKFDVLQQISREDKNKRFTPLEYEEATEALFNFMQFDLRTYHEKKQSKAFADKYYTNITNVVLVELKEFYSIGSRDSYTYFGNYLISLIERQQKIKPTLQESLEAYFNKSRGSRQDWTEKNKKDVIRYIKLFEETTGKRAFDKIEREDVEKYISERTNKVSPTSIKREITSMSAVWVYCSRRYDHDGKNPFSSPELPTYKPNRRETASLTDSKRLYKILTKDKPKSYVKPLLLIILLTGARLSEAWGIEQQDVDVNKRLFHIRPNNTRRTKNNSTIREQHLTDTLRKSIIAMNSLRKPENANSASASAVKFLKSEGFLFTPHGLRHGCKDRYDELRARYSDIEKLLGWSSGGMVRHYGSGELTNEQRTLMENLEELLKCK